MIQIDLAPPPREGMAKAPVTEWSVRSEEWGRFLSTIFDLWVRADVPETYIDGIHLGDKFTVRLPSGAERQGTVFYRGVDADYATQRFGQ